MASRRTSKWHPRVRALDFAIVPEACSNGLRLTREREHVKPPDVVDTARLGDLVNTGGRGRRRYRLGSYENTGGLSMESAICVGAGGWRLGAA